MKAALILVACVIAGAFAAGDINAQFRAWMVEHHKTYTGSQLSRAFEAYKINEERILRLNAQAKADGYDTVHAHNKFSDMTPAEFKARFLSGYKPVDYSKIESASPVFVEPTDVPMSWNWVDKQKTTPVKDQQQCGSCWAFSATEGIESAWLMAGKSEVVLSPQQIVSCDTVDQGCNGGDLPTAFAYVKSAGIEDNASYPYTSGNGDTGKCKYNESDVKVHISGFKYVVNDGRKNDTILATGSYANGPLSICVDASSWQSYTKGIIKRNCGLNIDHCVQLVGWGVQGSTEYWIIRNSWNTDWGLEGYIWIEKNSGKDLCGITTEATYVTL